MMNSPFLRNLRNGYSPSVRGIPVQRQTTSSPKVVSIPVHFVGSERTRSESALKIQKVFRGFLVRKSVKRIVSIRSEVEELERRVSQEETVDLIRRVPKERLKVNETLMALLFRLDSVRGVDSGVRDCRKAVIRRAIALQETVDAIVSGDLQALEIKGTVDGQESSDQAPEVDGDSDTLAEAVDQTLETRDLVDQTLEIEGQSPDLREPANLSVELQDPVVMPEATDETRKLQVPDYSVDSSAENPEKMDVPEVKASEEASVERGIVENGSAIECVEESVETSFMDNRSESSANSQSLIEGGEENTRGDGMEILQPERVEGNSRGREDNKQSNRELVERMMEDNEKLMGMMTKLFERNEMQTRLLSSLSHRVEQLERAFMCERLRRTKKKRHAAGVETLPNQSKCGK